MKDEFGPAIQEHFNNELVVPEVPFPQLTMAEAMAILKDAGLQIAPRDEG